MLKGVLLLFCNKNGYVGNMSLNSNVAVSFFVQSN